MPVSSGCENSLFLDVLPSVVRQAQPSIIRKDYFERND
jgi:hypothetical protein